MSEYHAIHIKINNDPTEFIDALSNYISEKIDLYKIPSNLFYHSPNPWITIILLGCDEADKIICEDLSRKFNTSCILINAFHSTDSIKFFQFNNGLITRHLSNGFGEDQYIWDTVEGEIQNWEETVFFEKKELEEILSHETELSDKEHISAIWQNKTIVVGEFFPMFDIDKLAKELKLSGFSWDNSHNDNEYWTIEKPIKYKNNSVESSETTSHKTKGILDKSKQKELPQLKLKKGLRVVGFSLLIIYAFTHLKFILVISILAILISFLLKNNKK